MGAEIWNFWAKAYKEHFLEPIDDDEYDALGNGLKKVDTNDSYYVDRIIKFNPALEGDENYKPVILKASNYKDFWFPSDVYFQGVTFEGYLGFINAKVIGKILFSEVRCYSDIDLSYCHVLGDVSFSKTNVASHLMVNKSIIKQLIVSSSEFNRLEILGSRITRIEMANLAVQGKAILNGLNLEEGLHTEDAVFRGNVDFTQNFYKKFCCFYTTKFLGISNFQESHFGAESHFDYSVFEKQAIFTGSVFSSTLKFSYLTANEPVDFVGCKFMGEADFSYSVFEKLVDFTGSKFESKTETSQEHLIPNFTKAIFKSPPDLSDLDIKFEYKKFISIIDVKFFSQVKSKLTDEEESSNEELGVPLTKK